MPHTNAPTRDLGPYPIPRHAQSPNPGYCTSCHHTRAGWVYLGPQTGPDGVTVAFHLWDCPSCRTTKSAPAAGHPPQPTDRRIPA